MCCWYYHNIASRSDLQLCSHSNIFDIEFPLPLCLDANFHLAHCCLEILREEVKVGIDIEFPLPLCFDAIFTLLIANCSEILREEAKVGMKEADFYWH